MTTTTAAEQLLRLHRTGRLASDYPLVRDLLADVPPESRDLLRRAGAWLSRLNPDEVLRAHPDTSALTVAITGHGTLAALIAPLTVEFARHGLLLRPVLSDFDSYVVDLSDSDSDLYSARPEIVLCLLDPALIFDEVPTPWRPEDVRAVFEAKVALVAGLAARFAERGAGTLVLNTIPLPRTRTAALVDHRSRAELGAAWREANARLLRLTAAHRNVVVVDTDSLLADGIPAGDARLSVYAKAHLSTELLAGYAREIGHLARNLTGRAKKVLAVDLDGTVWGGVLGDDGPEGIEVADGYRGEAFRAFQRTVRQLAAQGVLVAAVSKNDIEPVRTVLREHPGMTLREDDFVRVVANWRPKHENLVELAEDLNVGVDSVVFADDSPYERGLVRRELPAVAVITLDDEPAWHVDRLLADGWFDTVELTAEDRDRPTKYRDELVRKDFLNSFDSIQDYLSELGVAVRVFAAGEQDVNRVAQLSLRTNQFNLTTRRLQPADVQALIRDPDALVLALRTADRFGDNGLVGAILAHREADVLHIDNFLLSCRVFARGVEQTALSVLLRHARDTGAGSVVGAYRSSAKNSKVREFYPRNGFSTVTDDGAEAVFRHDLVDIAAPPEHVTLTEELG
ncbi:HAD family hydrolase [Kutzneria buriramensis]|uniref:HAD superfamily phosphatase (TIGR01681 family)/FkbH-like protein n=1 Tax=Kutzneria buriramensis TaxID=1045776 RepID=A0A3E0GVU1_9PSEU|nr:HAD-IIIC family phosphatase [Kutzneria buriramensis]REH27633.1 HAD superfamily phosphatase (TIGR01681 family)/FkbH-like protein [Kutzneria buriramensis]